MKMREYRRPFLHRPFPAQTLTVQAACGPAQALEKQSLENRAQVYGLRLQLAA